MTRVLLNTSTIIKGGALQVALSILQKSLDEKKQEITWFYAISDPINSQIVLPSERTTLFIKSPSKSAKERNRLKHLVAEKKFDMVFTLFGPAYVRFDVPHLCGVADGWVTHSDWRAFKSLSTFINKLKMVLLILYKGYWYRQADAWIVETVVAREGSIKRLGVHKDKVMVVPNTISPIFSNYLNKIISRKTPELFKILVLGADYEHKNYYILPKVILGLLKNKINNFRFTMTLPFNSKIWLDLQSTLQHRHLTPYLQNIGVQELKQLPELYQTHNILFFPTLLETFSVTPLESLCMGLPMVISNILANQEVVGNYAEYFNPEHSDEAVEKLSQMMHNYEKYIEHSVLSRMQDFAKKHNLLEDRYFAYKTIIFNMLRKTENNSTEGGSV